MTQARVPRSSGVPIHLITEDDAKFILETIGGPDGENVDGPEQFLILEQREQVEAITMSTSLREQVPPMLREQFVPDKDTRK